MAPFNKRQIGYIQAIAGRQQHVTLKCNTDDRIIKSDGPVERRNRVKVHRKTIGMTANDSAEDDAKTFLLHTWSLDKPPLGMDSRAEHNNNKLETADFENLNGIDTGTGNWTPLYAFNANVTDHAVTYVSNEVNAIDDHLANPHKVPSTERASSDGYLNSTDVKFRFTLPTGLSSTDKHHEFRWIVWRNKRPTMGNDAAADKEGHANLDHIREGRSFRNWAYDFFMGQSGRKRGFLGYTWHPKLDAEKDVGVDGEQYSGYHWDLTESADDKFKTVGIYEDLQPTGEEGFTMDDLMTMPLNREDYVIRKDVRFFLGKEHGKSHFEDRLHWDWNDPIDTPDINVLNSPTLTDKNYRWNMTLIGTSGTTQHVHLNASVRWTTKMESG